MAAPSVAVIGGGIIGCAAAQELAKRGGRVTLLERASPGAEASGAAAGLLSPLGPSPEPGPIVDGETPDSLTPFLSDRFL